jgi:type IV fimbrial biogenesis protein FimT
MLATRPTYGFTLIELMIAIAVLAILLTVGVPSFQTWMLNTRIRTTAEAMQNGLQLARAEAVRRNARVRFTLSGGTGWIVQTDGGTQIQTRPSAEGSTSVTVTATPTGATTVTFNALGIRVTNADATSSITQLDIDVPTSILAADQSRELRLMVSSGGQIRMCDPYFTASGDPRAC